MKKLIIATDFSKESDLCFSIAKDLNEDGVNVQAVHLDELSAKFEKLNLSEDLIDAEVNGQKVPAYLVDDIKDQLKRTDFDDNNLGLEVIKGKDFNHLSDHLSKHSKDDTYLCTALKPINFIERILFGSFVEKLIFSTPHPLILAKVPLDKGPRKIAVCFDPVQDSENLLSSAESFAKKFNCAVDIIYVESYDSQEIYQNVFATNNNKEADKNQLMGYNRKLAEQKFSTYKERFEKAGINCDVDIVLTVDSDPATDLKKHLKDNPVDFIFIEPHPGFRKSFRFNSTSYDLIRNVEENFVIIKE